MLYYTTRREEVDKERGAFDLSLAHAVCWGSAGGGKNLIRLHSEDCSSLSSLPFPPSLVSVSGTVIMLVFG